MKKLSDTFLLLSLYSLYFCCFFLSISTALMGAGAILMVGFYLMSGEIKRLPLQIKKHPITWFPLLLFIMLGIGVFYSEAGFEESMLILKKYRELVYFPIVFSLLAVMAEKKGNNSPIAYAKASFFCGAVTLMLLSFAMYFGLIPVHKYGYSTVHHITHSFFMALLGFWALQYMSGIGGSSHEKRAKSKYKWIQFGCILVFVLAVINLFFVAPGRTGMLVLIFLFILSIFQRLRYIHCCIAVFCIVVSLFALYKGSNNFSYQVNRIVSDVKNYTPEVSRSSIGMRFDWWHNSIILIKEKPILGYGTGSFRITQEKLVENKNTKLSDNPHNEYLMIAVQVGVVGELFFVLMLVALFFYPQKLNKEERNLLQGSVLAFSWGCLANSFLLDSHPSHYFMILAAVLCSKSVSGPRLFKKE